MNNWTIGNPHYLEIANRPLFTPDQVADIINMLDEGAWSEAQVSTYRSTGQANQVDLTTRSVLEQPVPEADEAWVGDLLSRGIAEINDEVFRFDIDMTASADRPNVLRYVAGDGDHFSMHIDGGPQFCTRKLSYSIQLSAPDGHSGGDLVFFPGSEVAERTLGTINVFPSFLHHTVTPLVSGTRLAIVGWIHGRTFR